MGGYSTAFGVEIANHTASLITMLRFLAKSVVLYHDGKEIENPSKDLIEKCLGETEEERTNRLVISYYDDIDGKLQTEWNINQCTAFNMTLQSLYYRNNSNIRIGAPHWCSTMIYVGCTDMDSAFKDVSWETLDELRSWCTKLVKQGRIECDVSKCRLVRNCCT